MENNPVPGQVLNWVQGSIAEDWHQHRGGGWVHKTAKVADSATIDKGAIIGNKTTINDWAKVGKWARIGDWVTIGEGATIGISTMISNKVAIGYKATVGSQVDISEEARIGYWARIGDKVTIGFRAKIGYRATVGNGARVGDRATIDDDASLCARGIASNGDTILAETKKSVISDEQKLANAKGSLEYLQTRLKTEKKTGADAKRKATEKEISSWNKEIEKLKEKIKKNKGNKMKTESIELKTILKLSGLKEGDLLTMKSREPEFEDPYANTTFVDEGKKNKAAKVCKLCGESPVYSSGECTSCFYTNHCETCDKPLGKKSKNGMCDNCIQMSESKESKKSFKQYLKEAEVTSKKKKS